jgi:hypothetical protein
MMRPDPMPSPASHRRPVAVLAVQLVFVRPRLTRRSDAVLAGQDAPRSHAHHVYVVLEAVKTVALLGGGILLLAT